VHAYPCVSGSCSRYVSFLSLYGATSVFFLVAVVLYDSVLGGGMLIEVAATELVAIPLTVLSFMLLSLVQLFIAIVSHKPDINNNAQHHAMLLLTRSHILLNHQCNKPE
jgi:hypothetical protein